MLKIMGKKYLQFYAEKFCLSKPVCLFPLILTISFSIFQVVEWRVAWSVSSVMVREVGSS